MVQGRRPDNGLQHLLQLESVHQHWPSACSWPTSGAGKLPGGKKLTLDTKVCNAEWLPEVAAAARPAQGGHHRCATCSTWPPASGREACRTAEPFEWPLGHDEKSPFAKLKADPGTEFNYSNAGVAHLVLIFQQAAGKDLFPFLKERVFDPIGMENVTWKQIGGNGKIGPYSQGYSGVMTTPREHARFCYLALHKGEWAGNAVVPADYYDFAWQGPRSSPDYGGQWWVYPRHKDAPNDLVQTAGASQQPRLRRAEPRPGVRAPGRRREVSRRSSRTTW